MSLTLQTYTWFLNIFDAIGHHGVHYNRVCLKLALPLRENKKVLCVHGGEGRDSKGIEDELQMVDGFEGIPPRVHMV